MAWSCRSNVRLMNAVCFKSVGEFYNLLSAELKLGIDLLTPPVMAGCRHKSPAEDVAHR